MNIPFNKPYMTGKELWYIAQAHSNGHLAGDGFFTKSCSRWLESSIGCKKALLTHSCTAALEMAALLANLGPGDEVIMPSYTFVSTANAFVLRGAVPVFVDIRPDTLNIDENLIEAAITPRTKAIIPVHYAGVACEMDTIMEIAKRHDLIVIEDAAQGIMSKYKGRPLGSIGHLGCLSFHETKNIISGEGGALLINDPELVQRAEIIREKGTNRSQFFRGQVDKYTWCDLGSSFLPGELIAAFLWAQMEAGEDINSRRIALWNRYNSAFEVFERNGRLRRPVVPDMCIHNAHMYYVLLPSLDKRAAFISYLKSQGIGSVFHYVPLHSAPAARDFSRYHGDMDITDQYSDRLVRLPLWVGLEAEIDEVIGKVSDAIAHIDDNF
ncbi:TDP-4-keto-6-deoxy-D-glucose transaminase family protein [Delftia acidovorans]|uniref:dTDP-4-amino-4,6-dideoxygalactose transaminase n=1 Tax=Delftia acidovorans TaxID=80866 RepID=UPI000500EA73|nr:dTDP-4-amino-4,6-dideoxygalactose transaminase [Delftia acidovorans]KFJ14238.1 TDP-4-keto-6-deoxy-D-glucose transaminase family protein [Delftia acidovorans]QQB49309.1 dTDP-4-amino-4,6-dideoxygalactose transaminase [Delftia acidovorans]